MKIYESIEFWNDRTIYCIFCEGNKVEIGVNSFTTELMNHDTMVLQGDTRITIGEALSVDNSLVFGTCEPAINTDEDIEFKLGRMRSGEVDIYLYRQRS